MLKMVKEGVGGQTSKSVFVMGVYHEEFRQGIKYRVYDLVIDVEGDIRFRNYRDVSNLLNKEVVMPSIIELSTKDLGKYLEDEFYQSEFGRNIYWYSDGSVRDNILYRPLEVKENEVLIRYVLKDDIESGFYNVLKNKKGILQGIELSDDDMIMLSGIGLESIVYHLSQYLEKVKSVIN